MTAAALRTLALVGACRFRASEHGWTLVCRAREDVPQAAEDALDALVAAGWAETPLPGSGSVLTSPGPVPDVIPARALPASVLDALWLLVEAADAARLRDLTAMRHAYRLRQLARRRRNRRRSRR